MSGEGGIKNGEEGRRKRSREERKERDKRGDGKRGRNERGNVEVVIGKNGRVSEER